MKVVKARKEHECCLEGCSLFPKTIKPGEVYCVVTQLVNIGNKVTSKSLYYHWECWKYLKSQEIWKQERQYEAVVEKETTRKAKKLVGGPRGRPRLYSDPLKARNLLSLRCYHRKEGNLERVRELEVDLEGLRIEVP